MQNYKNLAKNLFANKKNNFADFAQTTNTLQFVEELQPKTYYETYKDLYFGAKVFAVLAQIVTAISSYSFFVDLFAPKITNEYALIFCVCVVLVIIEIMKFITLNKALLGLFSLPAKPNYVLLSFALVLSICSIYASVIGGGNLGIDTQKVVTVKSEFDNEIATLRAEISDIQKRNSYKGNTYIVGKEKKLLHAKETTLQGLQAKKDNELTKVSEANEANANTFKIGFGLFDILFLFCTLYVWSFKKFVAIENLATELLITIPIDNKIIDSENVGSQDSINENTNTEKNAIPNQHGKIGFMYDFTHLKTQNTKPLYDDTHKSEKVNEKAHEMYEKSDNENRKETTANNDNSNNGNRKCLHCGTGFIYNAKKQKYCSDTCRVAAWELKTKRVLQFKPKKYSSKTANKPNLKTLF